MFNERKAKELQFIEINENKNGKVFIIKHEKIRKT